MSASRQTLRTSGGIEVSDNDSVIAVRDFPRRLAEVLVGVAAAVAEAVQRLGFFERGQVLALDVLDQRQLQHLGLVDVADDHRQLGDAGTNRRLVAALASDDLVAGAALPDDQRLDDPFLGQRGDQVGQVAHGLAGLVGVGVHVVDGRPCARPAGPPTRPGLRRSARRDASAGLPGGRV